MKKVTVISFLVLVWIIWLFSIFIDTSHSQEFRNDCNLVTQDLSKITADLGFFDVNDIQKAYDNMCMNCPRDLVNGPCRIRSNGLHFDAINDGSNDIPSSQYFFDHLIFIGKLKLEAKADRLGLQNDKQWVLLFQLREEAKKSASGQDIKTIPSDLRDRYNAIWQSTGSYDVQQALSQWIYSGSSGLYAKYNALCDLWRWMYLNKVYFQPKQWTTYLADTSYNQCKNYTTQQSILNVVNKQQALEITTFTTSFQKIQESMNQYSDAELKWILNTTQELTNNIADVTKKIDQPMKNCNP